MYEQSQHKCWKLIVYGVNWDKLRQCIMNWTILCRYKNKGKLEPVTSSRLRTLCRRFSRLIHERLQSIINYSWTNYRMGLEHKVNNRVSADWHSHSVINSSIVPNDNAPRLFEKYSNTLMYFEWIEMLILYLHQSYYNVCYGFQRTTYFLL